MRSTSSAVVRYSSLYTKRLSSLNLPLNLLREITYTPFQTTNMALCPDTCGLVMEYCDLFEAYEAFEDLHTLLVSTGEHCIAYVALKLYRMGVRLSVWDYARLYMNEILHESFELSAEHG